MSGGFFDYKQSWLHYELSESLDEIIRKNKDKDKDKDKDKNNDFEFNEKILNKLKETSDLAKKLAQMVHCVDYLLSGDYGEKTFLEQWDKRMKELEEKEK